MSINQQKVIELAEQFELTDSTIIELFSSKNSWEDKFRQLMLLGKQLPALPVEFQLDEYLVSGCESKVWLAHEWQNDKLYLAAGSDAKIVKGLVSVVLAAFNKKTSAQIQQFDLELYFTQLNLLTQLSPSRANGVHSIISKIQDNALKNS
jgi:cysteine desulfuration protein SufE